MDKAMHDPPAAFQIDGNAGIVMNQHRLKKGRTKFWQSFWWMWESGFVHWLPQLVRLIGCRDECYSYEMIASVILANS